MPGRETLSQETLNRQSSRKTFSKKENLRLSLISEPVKLAKLILREAEPGSGGGISLYQGQRIILQEQVRQFCAPLGKNFRRAGDVISMSN